VRYQGLTALSGPIFGKLLPMARRSILPIRAVGMERQNEAKRRRGISRSLTVAPHSQQAGFGDLVCEPRVPNPALFYRTEATDLLKTKDGPRDRTQYEPIWEKVTRRRESGYRVQDEEGPSSRVSTFEFAAAAGQLPTQPGSGGRCARVGGSRDFRRLAGRATNALKCERRRIPGIPVGRSLSITYGREAMK